MKKLTALTITLAMLCAVSCNGNTNVGDGATTSHTTMETVTETTEETAVTETTVAETEVETTVTETEETFDVDAFLAECTVYEVTTKPVMYTMNTDDPENAYAVQKDSYIIPYVQYEERWQKGEHFSERIAVHVTDLDGLILFADMWTEEKGFFHEITHIAYGNYVVTCSKALNYSERCFDIDVTNNVIAVKGDYSTDYYLLTNNGYSNVPVHKAEGNVTSRIDVFVSGINKEEMRYTYTNELFCDVHSLGSDLSDDYNSEDDLYMEYGKVVIDNGVPRLEMTARKTIGEWYQSDDFPYARIRDEYDFLTLRDMAKRFKSLEGYQEFIEIYEELERGKNDN